MHYPILRCIRKSKSIKLDNVLAMGNMPIASFRRDVTKLFRVLTDDFIGVKRQFLPHFSYKIDVKYYPKIHKVLNRDLLPKNRPKCRLIYNLVGANCSGINNLQGGYSK